MQRIVFLLITCLMSVVALPGGTAAATQVVDCAGLQAALDAASDGDVIQLSEPSCTVTATYALPDVSITLEGKSGSGTVFEASPPESVRLFELGADSPPVINVAPTLRNMTLKQGGAANGGAIYFRGNVSPTMTNLTFLGNSAGTAGGGLYVDSTGVGVAPVVIQNSRFGEVDQSTSRNAAFIAGGGAFVRGASGASLINNRFENNAAITGGGASLGMAAPSGSAPPVEVRGNTFTANDANSFFTSHGVGAGLFLVLGGDVGTDTEVTANTFDANTATGSGGGAAIRLQNGGHDLSIVDNDFFANELNCGSGTTDCGPSLGGGLYLLGVSAGGVVEQRGNLFDSNTLTETAETDHFGGGGEWIEDVPPVTSTGDRFLANTIQGYASSNCSSSDLRRGGGIGVVDGTLTAYGLVAAGNAIGNCGTGAGIEADDTAAGAPITQVTLENATVSGNQVGTAGLGQGINGDAGSVLSLENSIVEMNTGAGPDLSGFGTTTLAFTDACMGAGLTDGPFTGSGNICADPLLVDPGADVHETSMSPTRDAGSDALVSGAVTEDLDGEPRIQGFAVDMGADEWDVTPDDGATHDLAVRKVKSVKPVEITTAAAERTVKVTIQNQSPHPETIPDLATLAAVVDLGVASLNTGMCPDALVALGAKQKTLPMTLKPKGKLTVVFEVSLDCTVDDARGPGHEDFLVSASVDHTALDGFGDDHAVDDVCPHQVTPPYEIDPNPDGSIKDKGCGAKRTDKTYGDPMLIDVFVES